MRVGETFKLAKSLTLLQKETSNIKVVWRAVLESCCGSVMSYRSVWLKTGANILWACQVFSFAFENVMPSDHKYFH